MHRWCRCLCGEWVLTVDKTPVLLCPSYASALSAGLAFLAQDIGGTRQQATGPIVPVALGLAIVTVHDQLGHGYQVVWARHQTHFRHDVGDVLCDFVIQQVTELYYRAFGALVVIQILFDEPVDDLLHGHMRSLIFLLLSPLAGLFGATRRDARVGQMRVGSFCELLVLRALRVGAGGEALLVGFRGVICLDVWGDRPRLGHTRLLLLLGDRHRWRASENTRY